MGVSLDSTSISLDSSLVTLDSLLLANPGLSVIYSPALQAPITLSNPTAALTFASDSGSGVHQANPIPLQGVIGLVGAAVRMALAMNANGSILALNGQQGSIISGIVTYCAPPAVSLSLGTAAPSVISVNSFSPNGAYSISGTIADGQLLTLSGSNFGAIGPRLVYFKNFANESIGSRVAHGPDFIDSSIVSANPNGNGYAYCAGLTGGMLGHIESNDSRIGNEDSGASYGGINLAFNSLVTEVFSSGVHYFPPSCNYTPLTSVGNPQVKIDWAFANSIADTDIYHKICNQTIALSYVMDSDTAPWDGLQIGSNTQWVWSAAPYPKTGVPICHSRWVQMNASPGAGTGNIMWVGVWDGTSQTINSYNNNLVMAANGGSKGYNNIHIPGFVQDTAATDPNWSVSNNRYIVRGEIYVAINSSGNTGAAARVELGDAPTYASCSRLAKCTVESPASWNSSSIQFRLRLGVFLSFGISGLYLYVTTSNNVTTLVGRFQ